MAHPTMHIPKNTLLMVSLLFFLMAVFAALVRYNGIAIGAAALAEALFYISVTASVISWWMHAHYQRRSVK